MSPEAPHGYGPPPRTPWRWAADTAASVVASARRWPGARREAREARRARLAQPVGPLPVWAWLTILLLVGVAIRLVFFAIEDGMHYPDELFQYLEPPYWHLEGHGWQPWEFHRGARNWLIPWHYGSLMALLDAVGIHGHAMLRALWAHNAVLAALVVPLGFRLGVSVGRGDLRLGLLCAAACATFPMLGYFAPHTQAEWHGLLLGTWAYALWMEQVRRPGAGTPLTTAFLVGLLLGGVFIARVGLAVFIPLVYLDYNFRGRFRELFAALAGFAVAMLILAVADAATWGEPLHSLKEYIQFNWVEKGAERLEVKPGGWYWETLFLQRLGLATWVVLLPMLAFFHRHWRMILAWVIPFLLLSKVGIKQERFLSTMWPLLLVAAASGWLALGDALTRWRPLARRWVPTAVAGALLAVTVGFNAAGTADLEMRWRAGIYQAQDWVGDQPDATGVLIPGPIHLNGGGFVLHRNIPQRVWSQSLLGEPIFSHVIADDPALAKRLVDGGEFEQVAEFEQDVVVLRRHRRLVGASDSELPDTIVRTAGGAGGSESTYRCRPGTRLVGFDVVKRRERVQAARPLCRAADGKVTEGRWFGQPRGGRPTKSVCSSGQRVVGLYGRSGALMDSLGVVCAAEAKPDRRRRSRAVGGRGGDRFELECPDGYGVGALRMRSGAAVDGVGLVCER